MRVRKTEDADLRKRYTIFVQLGLVASLLVLIVLFSTEWRAAGSLDIVFEEHEAIEIEEIEQTQQLEEPPPPPQPPPPIEVPDDQIDEMIDLDLDMDLDLTATPPPPPPPPPAAAPPAPDPEPEIFVVVEQMPEPVGGIEGIQRRTRYPELARRAGIEGIVFVQFVVDEQGRVSELTCTRHPGGGTCEAAMDAIRATEFRPGRQRGQAVKVRFSLPVRFRLN
jgi:periplasmic protein TonB